MQFSKKHKINLAKPIKDLPETQLDLLLYGDQNINGDLNLDLSDDTVPLEYTGSYEGIIPMLKRWFSSPNSNEALRAWVEKYMQLADCTTCNGTRLKKESLWFKVDDRNIAELSAMNLDNLAAWFDGVELRLNNKQNAIAKDVLKEIRERLQFLLNVGLTYLEFRKTFQNIEWWRKPAYQAGHTNRQPAAGHYLYFR